MEYHFDLKGNARPVDLNTLDPVMREAVMLAIKVLNESKK